MGTRVVAAVGETVIHAQRQASRDDFSFRQVNERRVDAKLRRSFDSRFGREIGEALERGDVFRPAVWVSAVVQRVHSQEEIRRSFYLGEAERVGQEDCIAGRHVGHRDLAALLVHRTVSWNRDICREGGAAHRTEVQGDFQVPCHSGGMGDRTSRFQLNGVTLAVSKAQGHDVIALGLGDGEHGRRVESAGEEDNGAAFSHHGTRRLLLERDAHRRLQLGVAKGKPDLLQFLRQHPRTSQQDFLSHLTEHRV